MSVKAYEDDPSKDRYDPDSLKELMKLHTELTEGRNFFESISDSNVKEAVAELIYERIISTRVWAGWHEISREFEDYCKKR